MGLEIRVLDVTPPKYVSGNLDFLDSQIFLEKERLCAEAAKLFPDFKEPYISLDGYFATIEMTGRLVPKREFSDNLTPDAVASVLRELLGHHLFEGNIRYIAHYQGPLSPIHEQAFGILKAEYTLQRFKLPDPPAKL